MQTSLLRECADVYEPQWRPTKNSLTSPDILIVLHRLQSASCSASLWTDLDFSLALTRTLLRIDWGLTWDGPRDRLVPPVPNRLNYLLWIEDLIASRAAVFPPPTASGPVYGVDIGTGASCIFPLLGHAACGWNFAATEIDTASLAWATRNVSSNSLSHCVKLSLVRADEDVLSVVRGLRPRKADEGRTYFGSPALGAPSFSTNDPVILPGAAASCWDSTVRAPFPAVADFTMCNPPFFSSWEEAKTSMAAAAHKSVCVGTPSEMVRCDWRALQKPHCGTFTSALVFSLQAVEGGEAAFVARMAGESRDVSLRHAVTWYSSMLGKASSVASVLQALRDLGAPTVRTTTFRQGSTTRWGVAWSWLPPCAFLDDLWRYYEAAAQMGTLRAPAAPDSAPGALPEQRAADGTRDSVGRLVVHFSLLLDCPPGFSDALRPLPIETILVGRHELRAVPEVGAPLQAGFCRPQGVRGKRLREAPDVATPSASDNLPKECHVSGVTFDAACARIDEFLSSPLPVSSDPGCAVLSHPSTSCCVVAARGLTGPHCVRAWRGVVVEVAKGSASSEDREHGGSGLTKTPRPDCSTTSAPATGAADTSVAGVSPPLRLRFAFEVQLLVQNESGARPFGSAGDLSAEERVSEVPSLECDALAPAKNAVSHGLARRVHALSGMVAVCLLSSHDSAARAAFARFAAALERDTLRVSRKWRRMPMAVGEGPLSAAAAVAVAEDEAAGFSAAASRTPL